MIYPFTLWCPNVCWSDLADCDLKVDRVEGETAVPLSAVSFTFASPWSDGSAIKFVLGWVRHHKLFWGQKLSLPLQNLTLQALVL